MRYYIEYYSLSLGYVPNSMPPRFDDSHRRPIPAQGSQSIIPIDGRVRNRGTIQRIALAHARTYIGYQLLRGTSLGTARAVGAYVSFASLHEQQEVTNSYI